MSRPTPDSTRVHFSFSAPNILATILVVAALASPAVAPAAESAKTGSTLAPMTTNAHIIKFTPNMRISSLAGRPDSDLVELSDGKRVRVGNLRQIAVAAKKMRAARATRALPPGLRAQPAATGMPLQNRGDLAAALKLPGTDTLQLPSGRRLTAAQLRFLQPQIEKRLGRPIAEARRQPPLTGPALKVSAQTNWREILKKPDATVLESPSGKRITVGELRQALSTSRQRMTRPKASLGARP
jgi:hypothetical protein